MKTNTFIYFKFASMQEMCYKKNKQTGKGIKVEHFRLKLHTFKLHKNLRFSIFQYLLCQLVKECMNNFRTCQYVNIV